MALIRSGSKKSGGEGTGQVARCDYFNGTATHTYPSSLYGKKIFAACLSQHYSGGTITTMTWSCDTGNVTQIVNESAVGDIKFEAVKYEGEGTLSLYRATNSGTYYANIGLICSEEYDNLAVVATHNGGNGSQVVDISSYGREFIIMGVQPDYQNTSKITISTSDSDVEIIPYCPTVYHGYSIGAFTAYKIKSNGTGNITITWTANKDDKLGATRVMAIY